jgi:hypothetical protein
MVSSGDRGYVLVGYAIGTEYGSSGYDAYVLKVNATGGKVWERTYGGENWDLGLGHNQGGLWSGFNWWGELGSGPGA